MEDSVSDSSTSAMNDLRGRGFQPIRSSSGSPDSASLPVVNIDERTLDFSEEEIGSSPKTSAISSAPDSSSTAAVSTLGAARTGSDSVAVFLDEEIPSMLARKSQCPDFFPLVSAALASAATTSTPASFDSFLESSAEIAASSLTPSVSDSFSNSSSSIGSTFFDAFPPK